MSVSIIYTTVLTDPNDKWLTKDLNDFQNVYTEDEFNSVIKPFNDWIPTLNGYISYTMSVTDNVTKQTVYTFDTKDNADEAFILISKGKGVQHPIAKAKNTLAASKKQSLNIGGSHDLTISIIDNETNSVLSRSNVTGK